jgi:c-di-GMP-binding flagellar brake protein YcgR
MTEGVSGSRKQHSAEERRGFCRVRKEVALSCRIVAEGGDDEEGVTQNMSAGGLLLSTRRAIKVGTTLQVSIVLSAEGLRFDLPGRVVWSEFNGVTGRSESGVAFVGLDPNQRQNVMTIIGKSEHSDERRRFIRLQRRLFAEYKKGGFLSGWKHAHTQDISLGGSLLNTEEGLSTGQEVRVRIHLDDGAPKPFEAKVIVIDSQPVKEKPGINNTRVKFMPMEAAAKTRLVGYISKLVKATPIEHGPPASALPASAERVDDEGESAPPAATK